MTAYGRYWRRGALALIAVVASGVVIYTGVLAQLQVPPPTLRLLDRNGQFLAEISREPERGYGYWPIQQLPERVIAATLALEDKRFWQHPGVDPVAILRAVRDNFRHGTRTSGASTIAMQVARMQNPGPRTYTHKIMEGFTALWLTARYGRDEILRQYLCLVPYANNIHGIAYAARRYLNKPVDDLSWAEIAFLAAIPQAPSATNPFQVNGRERAIRRGQRILKTLQAKGVIDAANYALASTQLSQLNFPREQARPRGALHAIFKMDNVFTHDAKLTQGLREPTVRTSLDLVLQGQVQSLASQALAHWYNAGAQQTAVIVTRPQTGEVLAWLGSGDYFDGDHGALDYAQVPRSPGSTLKPFVYAHALDRGTITPGSVLYDLPEFANGFSNIDHRFLGPMLPRAALANSRNVPAIWLANAVGLDETYHFLGQLGLQDNSELASFYGVGMALGTLPVTLEKLVKAYGVLANDGVMRDLTWMKDAKSAAGPRLISADTARLVTLFLSDPMARLPTFPRMGTTEFRFPVAIKTGTSQGYRDAWAVAYSQDYLVATWVGRADGMPMHKLGGAGSAADLAQRIILQLNAPKQRDGFADNSFPAPQGYQPYTVCTRTGQRATGLCEPTMTEWFPAAQPPPADDRYLRLWSDHRNGNLADTNTPRQFLEPRTFMKTPGFMQQWAKANHVATLPMDFSEDAAAIDAIVGSPQLPMLQDLLQRAERPVRLTLLTPAHDLHLYDNFELPAAMNTLTLRVSVTPAVEQVVWYVDGKPFTLAAAPYTAQWPLTRGRHTFQVRLPYRDETSVITSVLVD